MFLYLYTNADAIGGFFAGEQKLTADVWERLESFFLPRLGARVTGSSESQMLVSGEIKPGAWLKRGLDVAETKLREYRDTRASDYIGFNLDNETKAYWRKLKVAGDPPGGEQQSNTDKSKYFTERLATMSNKEAVVGAVYGFMQLKKLSVEEAMNLIDELPLEDKVRPSRNELEAFIKERSQTVQFDRSVPFSTFLNEYTHGKGDKITQQIAMAWRKDLATLAGKVMVRSNDDRDFTLVGMVGLNFLLKQT